MTDGQSAAPLMIYDPTSDAFIPATQADIDRLTRLARLAVELAVQCGRRDELEQIWMSA